MNDFELTDYEIARAVGKAAGWSQEGIGLMEVTDCERAIAKAAQRKLVKWGSEHCEAHHTRMQNILKRTCNECWQELRKGMGL